MTENVRYGLENPHPFSKMKTELIWEEKYGFLKDIKDKII